MSSLLVCVVQILAVIASALAQSEEEYEVGANNLYWLGNSQSLRLARVHDLPVPAWGGCGTVQGASCDFMLCCSRLLRMQGSGQGSSGSCYRPVIDEDRLQDHACTVFNKVCIDQASSHLQPDELCSSRHEVNTTLCDFMLDCSATVKPTSFKAGLAACSSHSVHTVN